MTIKIATKKCDHRLRIGIDQIAKELELSTLALTTSKFNSLFTLLKKHIEPPLRAILVENNLLDECILLLPSNIAVIRDDSSLFLRYKQAISSWQKSLKKTARTTSNSEIFESAESLLYLTYKLKTLSPHSIRAYDKLESSRTIKTDLRGQEYCELCWRFTQRHKATEEHTSKRSTSLSGNFCEHHNRKTLEGERNYMKEQRYKAVFHNELLALEGLAQSLFFPTIDWYKDFLEDLTLHEQRKLAYELAHSGLNKKNRVETLKMLGEGVSASEAASALGLSRSSTYRILARAENEINKILLGCYLIEFSDSESNTPRQLRRLEALKSGQKLGLKNPTKEIARCYHKVKETPNLPKICTEASRNQVNV